MKPLTHLNAEFQRIVGRDKKTFLSDQRKVIEENNRRVKTRQLLNKIRDTKGTSISAQTDAFIDASFQAGRISRETQTS